MDLSGTSFTIHSDRCPFALGTSASQVAVWSLGVFTAILAAYLSAAPERSVHAVYDYQPVGRQV